MTQILVIIGALASAIFISVILIEGVLRQGYKPTYHVVSALALGERGWIQFVNFLQLGVGMLAFAAGIYQMFNSVLGALFVAIFGMGALIVGIFRMDPMRGYPPGTPIGTPAMFSLHHKVHDTVSPIMFLAICGACIALAGRLEGTMREYTVLTAAAGLALIISMIIVWKKDAKYTGIVQRALIIVFCSWISLLGIHLL